MLFFFRVAKTSTSTLQLGMVQSRQKQKSTSTSSARIKQAPPTTPRSKPGQVSSTSLLPLTTVDLLQMYQTILRPTSPTILLLFPAGNLPRLVRRLLTTLHKQELMWKRKKLTLYPSLRFLLNFLRPTPLRMRWPRRR